MYTWTWSSSAWRLGIRLFDAGVERLRCLFPSPRCFLLFFFSSCSVGGWLRSWVTSLSLAQSPVYQLHQAEAFLPCAVFFAAQVLPSSFTLNSSFTLYDPSFVGPICLHPLGWLRQVVVASLFFLFRCHCLALLWPSGVAVLSLPRAPAAPTPNLLFVFHSCTPSRSAVPSFILYCFPAPQSCLHLLHPASILHPSSPTYFFTHFRFPLTQNCSFSYLARLLPPALTSSNLTY